MGGRRTLSAGDAPAGETSELTPPAETGDAGAQPNDRPDGAAKEGVAGDTGGTGFAALTGAESEIAAQQNVEETAEIGHSEAVAEEKTNDVPAAVRAEVADQLPNAVAAYFDKIGADKPAERDAMLDDDAMRRRIDELVQASIERHKQDVTLSVNTAPSEEAIDALLGKSERDEAAEAAHKAETARRSAEEKAERARERESARRQDEAEAAFASAQASSSDERVTPDMLEQGGFAIRLETGGRFATDIAAIDVTRDRFSWDGGRAIYTDPIVLDPDVEPTRVEAAWLIGEGIAKRCEVPNGIAAGGGLTAQLPGGSLAF